MVLSLLSLWGVRVPLARHLVQQGYGIWGLTAIAISAFRASYCISHTTAVDVGAQSRGA